MIMDVFGRLILTTALLTPDAKPAPVTRPLHHELRAGRTENDWLHAPTAREGRPVGDQRSAEQIVNANPALKDFLGQAGSHRLETELRSQVGDWTETNLAPHDRANAMYDLARVTNFLDNVNDRRAGASERGNDKIDGFSHYYRDGYGTEPKSEARLLERFASEGYAVLGSLGI